MSFSNHRFRWLVVFGGLICLFVGNTGTAQDKSSRDRMSPVDGATVQQVTGATFDDPCNANPAFPPCDDETRSLGSFAILVDPVWRKNLTDCAGYDSDEGILTSPTLEDPATLIGRSMSHPDGGALDIGGNPVGKKGTPISDASFSLVPTDKAATGFEEGPPGTREVHTELWSLNLCAAPWPTLPCVRAGDAAIVPPLPPISPGEVESKSGDVGGDEKQDFPAESFFNIFVEVDLPMCGSVPFGGAVVYNDEPLLVTNNDLGGFPPEVVYIHGSTPAVPVYFKLPDLGGKWVPGQLFGWLILAGHGVGVSDEDFAAAMAGVTPMHGPDPTVSCDSQPQGSGITSCDAVARDYAYPVWAPNNTLTDVWIGTHDNDPNNYANWCVPAGWSKSIERNDKKMPHNKAKTPGTNISPGPDGFCPYVIHFTTNKKVQGLPNGRWTFGFDNPTTAAHGDHDVAWQALEKDKGMFVEDWTKPVGQGLGPVHGPWLPKKDVKVAVLLGNTNYGGCANDLPGVIGDVINKQNALENAGWKISIDPNKTADEMYDAINKQFVWDGAYIVWYSGHGRNPTGALVGVNCNDLTANDLVSALKGQDALVILDSCYGADFANAVNAKLGGAASANGVGFITGGDKGECTKEDGQKGLFSRCFIEGLNGAADVPPNGNGDGQVTVAEAAAYAVDDPIDPTDHHCVFVNPVSPFNEQHPTWDGEHAGWVIGATKTPPGLCTAVKQVCKGGDRDGKNCCPGLGGVCDSGLCDGGTRPGQDCCPNGGECVTTAGRNAGCWSGCLTCASGDPFCDDTPVNLELVEETNFTPVHLALVQADLKINRFQEAVTEILLKQKPPPKKIEKVGNVQDAIAAIVHDYKQQGAGRVVIFGHGGPGHFKIGKDDLADPEVQEKFTKALAGMFKSLTLYGSEVSQGAEGQAFLKKLTEGLKRPVYTWTGKVYAFPNKWPDGNAVPPELANGFFVEPDTKKDIPAVTEWGMVVMILLVLAAGTVVIRRARAVAAQA